MKHVEKFIRHLQSSIEKRKALIGEDQFMHWHCKSYATYFYAEEDEKNYKEMMDKVVRYKKSLKILHKQQKTETEMLKWLENIRSCHEEMLCAMYGEEDNVHIINFSLEEEQHD